MASKPILPNHLLKLRKSIASINKDISFLKNCLQHQVTPISHRVKLCRTTGSACIRRKLEKELVKHSINSLYSKLELKSRLAYQTHLLLAKKFPLEFDSFYTKVKVAEECEAERKRKIHYRKLKHLITSTKSLPQATEVHNIDGFVVNRSSQQFTSDQMDLLNKGLNFAISSKPDIEQTIIDIETGITCCSFPKQKANTIRSITSKAINRLPTTLKDDNNQNIVKELRDKEVYYVKADKGNALVIMDKDDYDRTLQDKLDNGPYRQQRLDPLPNMVKKVDNVLKTHTPILGNKLKHLKISNPTLPRIKGLPKVHKPGKEMREIVSAVNAPTQKLAKWLVKEFKHMPNQAAQRSVKNSVSFTKELLASGGIADDEVMVSFDVTALYPSIPVGETMDILQDWLLTQGNGSSWQQKVKSYIKLTRTCMEENYFIFRGKFYKQLKGAPMGNPLSSTLSDIFMDHLESKLHKQGLLPDRWWRYVDDVFSIVKRSELPRILESINSAHRNIHFTHEIEKDNKLAFLDILVIRKSGDFTFEIYRKPTNTMRVIPNTSNHSYQHKMAAFHHMAHRMVTIPLSPEGVLKETAHIIETARLNGYADKTVQSIIDKKRRQQQFSTLTTLTKDRTETTRICTYFDKNLSSILSKDLRKLDIDLVHSSRQTQLTTLLGSTKDAVDRQKRSGIYEVKCPECDKVYIGQTRRSLETRLKEHLTEICKADKDIKDGKNHHFRSKVAEHAYTENHTITIEDAKIIRQVTNPWKLDVAESIEIHKRDTEIVLNRDIGNGHSWLFKHIPTYK